MKKCFIVILILIMIFMMIGCSSNKKFTPSTCRFNNEEGSVIKFRCMPLVSNTKGVQFSLMSDCNAIKASDCPSGEIKKLKISGNCNEEIENIEGTVTTCASGLVSGQQVDLELELSYTLDGKEKVLKGKLIDKVR